MTKAIIRVPTGVDYAYVEKEIQVSSDTDIKTAYNELFALMHNKGIPTDLCTYLVNLFNEDFSKEAWGKMSPEQYEELSQCEKDLVQAIKRFYKRLPVDEE